MLQRWHQLHPIHDLEGKQFYKIVYIIDRDESVRTRVTLNVPDSALREELICRHYLARYVEIIVKDDISVTYQSRDQPWDFEVSLSNGDHLKIEITAIADGDSSFRKMKYEDRINRLVEIPNISLHELEKLNGVFPDYSRQLLIESYKSNGLSKKSRVDNPYFKKGPFVFLGTSSIKEMKFGDILIEAIKRKVNKTHQGKEEVVLIIDNRTIAYDLEDIIESLDKHIQELENMPFKEIWIYTGYYSDLSGNDAEYTFIPIKISKEYRNLLNRALQDPNNK